MPAFVFPRSPGLYPGRKRCPLPEIENPNYSSRNATGKADVRSLLALAALTCLFVAGFHFLGQRQAAASIPANRAQAQIPGTGAVHSPPSPVVQGSPASSNRFGWLAFIAQPLYLALRFLHDHGIPNWGWTIVVLTVLFNLLIVWPRIQSMKSSLKMMRLQPRIDALRKRYSHLKFDDPRRPEMNQEMIALYRAEGASMFGGFVPLLLQVPLLLAYFSVLRNAAELHQAKWLWLADLSQPDPLHILPVLIVASMILAQGISPAPGMSRSQRWMFAMLMSGAMGFSLWHYASGLALYWFTCNVINLVVQTMVNRSRLGREMKALAAKRVKPA